MIQRNRAEQDARGGGVFTEGIEKTGDRYFGFCGQRESPVLQGRKRLREEECGSQDERMALGRILNEIWKSKMEIPDEHMRLNGARLAMSHKLCYVKSSMKFVVVLCLVSCSLAQPAKRTASLVVRDPATGDAPRHFFPTLIREEGSTREGWNPRTSKGGYRIEGVPAGTYRLELTVAPPAPYMNIIEKTVTLAEGQELTIDVVDVPPEQGSFGGRVLDEGGQAVANARVTVMTKSYAHGRVHYGALSRHETDALGSYRFEGLQPGRTYIVRANRSGWTLNSPGDTFYPDVLSPALADELVLMPGERREGIDIRRQRVKSYCVDGGIEGSSGAVTGIEITSLGVVFDMPVFLNNLIHSEPPEGKFLVCGLPTGHYYFMAAATPGADWSSVGANAVDVQDQDVHGLILAHPRGVAFNSETAWKTEPTKVRPQVKVNLPIIGWRTGFTLVVPNLGVPDKSTVTVDLWPGEYDIHPVQLTGSAGVYVDDITWNGKCLLNGVLTVARETQACAVKVILSDDGASLSAHVVDEAGAPVAYAYVTAFPSNVGSEAAMAEQMIIRQADQNGYVLAKTVRPGRYTLIATRDKVDSGVGSSAKLWKAKPHADEVQVSARAAVDVKLVQGGDR